MVNKDVYYYRIATSTSAYSVYVLAIAHSLLLDLAYGTVCQPSCESRTQHSDNFDEHSKSIYLVTDSAE